MKPMSVMLLALLLVPQTGRAQGGDVLDQGVFVITQGKSVIGREEFVVRRGHSGAPGEGFTISTTAVYPPAQPKRTLAVKVELSADSQPAVAEFRLRDATPRTVLIRVAPRRVTVRTVTPAGESVREYPAGARTLLRDDAVFAVYLVLPGMVAGRISGLAPLAGSRAAYQLADLGPERIRVKGVERPLRHLSLSSDDGTVHLWYDERGRLIQVTIPTQDLVAVRDPS